MNVKSTRILGGTLSVIGSVINDFRVLVNNN